MKRQRVLVTGAAGMAGRHLVKRAAEAGYRVRAMVRSADKEGLFDGLDVELVQADLAKPESLPPAVEDANIVVHLAAQLGDWGPVEKYRAINVYALEHMLTMVQRQPSFKRWVQASTLGVYPARHHYGTDETLPPDPVGLDGYTRTKMEAEVLLNRYVEQYDFPGVILRPGFMYGPGDRHVVPRIVERLASGTMRLVGDGRKLMNNTYVGNFVDAILLAMEKEEALGETFNVRDPRLVSREEFVGTIADYMGKPRPRRVPEWLARTAAGIIEPVAKARGRKTTPLLTKTRVKFLTLNLDFSIEKVKEKLGYRPRGDFQEGIREAMEWLMARRP